jgi:hypothetical protein
LVDIRRETDIEVLILFIESLLAIGSSIIFWQHQINRASVNILGQNFVPSGCG